MGMLLSLAWLSLLFDLMSLPSLALLTRSYWLELVMASFHFAPLRGLPIPTHMVLARKGFTASQTVHHEGQGLPKRFSGSCNRQRSKIG